jgi:hypothetical protein
MSQSPRRAPSAVGLSAYGPRRTSRRDESRKPRPKIPRDGRDIGSFSARQKSVREPESPAVVDHPRLRHLGERSPERRRAPAAGRRGSEASDRRPPRRRAREFATSGGHAHHRTRGTVVQPSGRRICVRGRGTRPGGGRPPAYQHCQSHLCTDVTRKRHPVGLPNFGPPYLGNGERWTLGHNGQPIQSLRPSIECRRRIGAVTSSSGPNRFRSIFKPQYLGNGERWRVGVNGERIGNPGRPFERSPRISSVTSHKGRNRILSFYEIGLSLVMGRSSDRYNSETERDGRFVSTESL